MPRRSRLWIVLAAPIALAAAAIFVWRFLAAEWLIPVVAARVEIATGLKLAADGPVGTTFLPGPGLRIADVRFVSPGRPGDLPRLHADSFEMGFAWGALLRGHLDVARFDLRRVRVLAEPLHPPIDVTARFAGPVLDVDLAAGGATAQIKAHPDADGLVLDSVDLRAGDIAAAGSGQLSLNQPCHLLLTLDRIVRAGTSFGSAALAASYGDDGLLLERGTWQSSAGWEIALFGHAAPDHGQLRFEGGIDASGSAASAISDASARFDGSFGATGLDLSVGDLSLRADGARLTGRLKFAPAAEVRSSAELRLDRLDVRNASASPLALLLTAVSTMDDGSDADIRLRIGEIVGAKPIADGVILDAGRRNGTFELRELAARSFGGAPLRAAGRFSLRSDLVASFDEVKLNYGSIAASGHLQADFTGRRPHLAADFVTGPLALDEIFAGPPALPPEPMTRRAAARAAAAQRAPEGWSRQTLDLPQASPLDADVTLSTPTITWRSHRLTDVHAALRLTETQLAVDDLSGTIYGGRMALSGRVETQARPHFAAVVQLAGADLESVLVDLAGITNINGRSTVTAELEADGGSLAEIAGSLAGNVGVSAQDGMLTGIDLPALSARLKRLDRPAGIVEVARLAGGGGRTPFSQLSGHFRIDRGVARTDDLRLVARSGEARTRGTIDLPAWTMNLANEFRLTDPPGMPPLLLKLDGPIPSPRRVFDISQLQSYLLRRPAAAGR